jgi:PKD repeat protein
MRRVVGNALLAIRPRGTRRGRGTRGQSLTELALILPVFILIILIGLDLGRAFLGWVSLQQAARIAANFASVNPTAWGSPGNSQTRQRYKDLILNEGHDVDWSCDLPSRGQLPDPTFPNVGDGSNGKAIGSPAKVTLTCAFHLATPIIGAFLPDPLTLASSASFPIRTAALPGQAVAQGPKPDSAFTWTPTTATSGQSVQFYDASTAPGNAPVSGWSWDFGDGGTDVVGSPTHAFTCASATCQFTVTLTASNINGADASPASHVINVSALNPAPIACFSPTTGSWVAPKVLTLDASCSQNPPYSWEWNFGDGTPNANGSSAPATTSHTFNCNTGTCPYNVTLTLTNGTDAPSVFPSSLTFTTQYCTIPNFVNMPVKTQADLDAIGALWTGAGFNILNLTYAPSQGLPTGKNNTKVRSQSPSSSPGWPCSSSSVRLNWS